MPFSLALFLYNNYFKKTKSTFDKNNKVLSQADIYALLAGDDKRKTLQIFRSAVVDHVPIDGTPYFLSYPVNLLFYHDGHKKAVIANAIAAYDLVQTSPDCSEAVMMLDRLTVAEHNAGYIQVLAWKSLGKLAQRFPGIVESKREALLCSFRGSAASLLGALIFLEALHTTSKRYFAVDMIREGCPHVHYRLQKVVLLYFLKQSAYSSDFLNEKFPLDQSIHKFISLVSRNFHFSAMDFAVGCRVLNLIGQNHEAVFWAGTSQSEVASILSKNCREYIQVIGAFLRRQ